MVILHCGLQELGYVEEDGCQEDWDQVGSEATTLGLRKVGAPVVLRIYIANKLNVNVLR